jgi:hypothetical protein
MLDELKYTIFFILAFSLIGYYGVEAIRMIDMRIAHEIAMAVMR